MLVISDNSPLSALAEIGLIDLLPKVVVGVTITASVVAECQQAGAPAALRAWIANPPSWVSIVPDPGEFLQETAPLGAGEASAITFAWNHRTESQLILDEKRGRAVARALGLPVTGLLAIVTEAAILGMIELDDVLSKLSAAGFRLSPSLIEAARRKFREAGNSESRT